MKYQSVIVEHGGVSFPAFMAERVYMREFYKDKGLPDDLSRWQPTVDQMLDGIDADGPIYIMIDQAIVQGGKAHRREGIHIDGYWNPGVAGHGTHREAHEGGTHSDSQWHGSRPVIRRRRHHDPKPSGHKGIPWGIIREGHMGTPPSRHSSGVSDWGSATFDAPEGLILASNLRACMGYNGEFDGPIGEGGDCSHVDLTKMDGFILKENKVYVGNVTCLHESIPVDTTCERTLVRLNVPGWTV